MTRPDSAAPDSAAPDSAAPESTAPESTAVLLDAEQVDELRRLLGTVEDWLLHAGDEARDDLAEFLTGLGWSTGSPERLAAGLIADLGAHTVWLRRALTHALPARETR